MKISLIDVQQKSTGARNSVEGTEKSRDLFCVGNERDFLQLVNLVYFITNFDSYIIFSNFV